MVPQGLGILFMLIGTVKCHTKCCEEENFIINGTCIDGSGINLQALKCEARFILESNEYVLAENNSLYAIDYLKPVEYTSDAYCIGKQYEDKKTVAIICENEFSEDTHHSKIQPIFAFISVVFMFLTVLIYFLVPQLRDLQGKCIMHSLVALVVAFFSLALLQIIPAPEKSCVFMAFLIYSSFLLAFFWLNVVSFNVWRKIMKPNMWNKKDDFWYLVYCVYAYGATAVFIIATLTAHHTAGEHIKPQFGEGSCFFNGTLPTWTYFYGPISVLLVINLLLFVCVSLRLWLGKQPEQSTNIRSSKFKCLLTMKLFFIMGLFWIFEVVSFALHDVHEILNVVWILTDYLNVIQGILIFLVLVVFRKKALRGLAHNSYIGTRFPRSWQTLEDEECLEDEEESKASNV